MHLLCRVSWWFYPILAAALLFLFSRVWLFVTPWVTWTAAHQAFLSFTISQSLLKLMLIESVMPSNHLILCHPLLLPSIFPSIRVFKPCSLEYVRESMYHLGKAPWWAEWCHTNTDYILTLNVWRRYLTREREQIWLSEGTGWGCGGRQIILNYLVRLI